jgi:hypothetical protein
MATRKHRTNDDESAENGKELVRPERKKKPEPVDDRPQWNDKAVVEDQSTMTERALSFLLVEPPPHVKAVRSPAELAADAATAPTSSRAATIDGVPQPRNVVEVVRSRRRRNGGV